MRIGIFTQPLWANYGGSLQNFALQVFLKKLGHEPITFREKSFPRLAVAPLSVLLKKIFVPGISLKRRIKRFCFLIYRFLTLPFFHWWLIDFLVIVFYRILKKMFGKFRGEIFKFGGETPDFRKFHDAWIDYRMVLFPPSKREVCDCEAFVVGSDQVWRASYNYHELPTMFLEFARNFKNIKRISYAASFGLDNVREVDSGMLRRCKKLLQKFDAVSVREDSGVDICRNDFCVDAVHLLDPTLLLDKADYEKVIAGEGISESGSGMNIVAAYILDESPKKSEALKIVSDFFAAGTQNLKEKTVPGWLRGFAEAKFVVTDSFHGMVFSIIFNKPFVAVGNVSRGMARFTSLLKIFGLGERLIMVEEISRERILQIINSPVDWRRVNEIRSREQSRSREFLENALK